MAEPKKDEHVLVVGAHNVSPTLDILYKKALLSVKGWERATQPGPCSRCGEMYYVGDPVAEGVVGWCCGPRLSVPLGP